MEPEELLALCGNALYGDNWKLPMASYLAVDPRTFRRWTDGKCPDFTHPVWNDIRGLVGDAIEDILTAYHELEKIEAG